MHVHAATRVGSSTIDTNYVNQVPRFCRSLNTINLPTQKACNAERKVSVALARFFTKSSSHLSHRLSCRKNAWKGDTWSNTRFVFEVIGVESSHFAVTPLSYSKYGNGKKMFSERTLFN